MNPYRYGSNLGLAAQQSAPRSPLDVARERLALAEHEVAKQTELIALLTSNPEITRALELLGLV